MLEYKKSMIFKHLMELKKTIQALNSSIKSKETHIKLTQLFSHN
jgi:predicted 2-oxoglutarate/Fe(II)-dependent dioxygenase YbiX